MTTFNAEAGLIVVDARIWGPSGLSDVRLALDTGATATLVRTNILVSMGYDPAISPERVSIITGSGVEYVPLLSIERIDALGQTRRPFPILAHTIPPGAGVDGVLGLDFLRARRLVIDFRKGRITFA